MKIIYVSSGDPDKPFPLEISDFEYLRLQLFRSDPNGISELKSRSTEWLLEMKSRTLVLGFYPPGLIEELKSRGIPV